jgi:hypothetical protein
MQVAEETVGSRSHDIVEAVARGCACARNRMSWAEGLATGDVLRRLREFGILIT